MTTTGYDRQTALEHVGRLSRYLGEIDATATMALIDGEYARTRDAQISAYVEALRRIIEIARRPIGGEQ